MALAYTALLTGNGFAGWSTSPGTIVPTVSVAVGDVILVACSSGGGSFSYTSVQDGDTGNSAAYTQLAGYFNSTINLSCNIFWKRSGQARDATAWAGVGAGIVVTTSTNKSIDSWTGKVAGFTGTPTAGSINNQNWSQTVGSTNVQVPDATNAINTDQDGEFCLMDFRYAGGGSNSTGFTGWTINTANIWRRVVTTAGTNIAVNAGVWTLPITWVAVLAAIYDQVQTADPLTVIGKADRSVFGPRRGFGRMARNAAGLLVPDLNLARI